MSRKQSIKAEAVILALTSIGIDWVECVGIEGFEKLHLSDSGEEPQSVSARGVDKLLVSILAL